MTNQPVKQALSVPPAQINRIVEAGMKVVYGMDVTVHEVRQKDHNMTTISFTMNEPEPVTRLGLGRYRDDDPLAQGEG